METYNSQPKFYYVKKDCPKTNKEIVEYSKLNGDDILIIYSSYLKKIAETFNKKYTSIENSFVKFIIDNEYKLFSLVKYSYMPQGAQGSEIRVLVKTYVFSYVYDYIRYQHIKCYYDLCLIKNTDKAQMIFSEFILYLLKKYYASLSKLFTFICECDLLSIKNGDIYVSIPLSSRGAVLKVPISAIVTKDIDKINYTPITLFKNRKFRCMEQYKIKELFKTKQAKRLIEWLKGNE